MENELDNIINTDLNNIKISENNIDDDKYNRLLNNEIFNLNNIVDSCNNTIEQSITQDSLLKAQLDIIDNKRNEIENKFKLKLEICKEYMQKYLVDNHRHNQLFDLYTTTILDIINKNKEYNTVINQMLNEYTNKYKEYIDNIDDKYPKNFLIQIVSNIIILNNNKYKMNLIFKESLKEELNNQIIEIKDIEEINDKINLNKKVLNHCEHTEKLINDLKNGGKLEIDEKLLKSLISKI